MTPQEFAYWLQGFFELSGETKLTEPQVQMIRQHLALVFHKVTPGAQTELPPLGPTLGDLHTWLLDGTGGVKIC